MSRRARTVATLLCCLVGGPAMVTGCRQEAAAPEAEEPPATAAKQSTEPVAAPSDALWYGAYLGGQKIGYTQVSSRELPEPVDGAVMEYTTTEAVDLNVLGQPMQQTSVGVYYCDAAYRPVRAEFTFSSQGRETALLARFEPDRILTRKVTADGDSEQTTPIPAGARLLVDDRALLAGADLREGWADRVHIFNPLTLSVDEHTLRYLRREVVDGAALTVVEMVGPFMTVTMWIDGEGSAVRYEVPLMSQMVSFRRESREQATAGNDDAVRVDLIASSAITPDQPIERPRETSRLVVLTTGLERLKALPTDHWQQVEPLPDGRHRVTVRGREPGDAEPPAGPPPADLDSYLAATLYIESDHQELREAAQRVLTESGLTSDSPAAQRAAAIHDWVNQRVRWQSNIGLIRSALEVLRDPAGVCRDTAALYAGLARAAGLPTKVVAGLLYVNGAFLGHAWAETWIDGRWVAYDATTPTHFVDATHLKLAEGQRYTALFEMLPALAGLRIEVERVEHQPR